MPIISPEAGYLTVINLFRTDEPERLDRLVNEMRAIVDTAVFPGWVSSTVHRGQDKLGTANFIQWQGKENLESRYAADDFKHRTIPVFSEITTYVRLMQTEVVLSQHHPSLGGITEISPARDDYTAIEIFGVAPKDQDKLVATFEPSHEWLVETPGFRTQNVLRGLRSRTPAGEAGSGDLTTVGVEHDFVVVYSQWADKRSFDAYRATPAETLSPARRKNQEKRDSLITATDWNTYRVVHSRSAEEPVRA